MEIRDDDILDAFIKTATGGFAVNKDPRFAEVAAEQRRRYREAFAALPLSAALPADVIATARKYNELPAPEHLAAGNLAHLNLAGCVGERVIGLLSGVPEVRPPAKPIDDDAVDVGEEDPELAAEAILGLIDSCALSGSGVGKAQSREFWRTIQAGLKTRLAALGG